MIIWRGWGILSFVCALVGIGGGMGLGSALGLDTTKSLLVAGLGALAGAAANWFIGVHLNVTKPEAKVAEYLDGRAQFLQAAVERGDFSLGPGHPRPQSYAEAQGQADWLLDQERKELAGAKNRHTLFWIPMQYLTFVLAPVGVLMFINGLIG